jgi:hypothetical protein
VTLCSTPDTSLGALHVAAYDGSFTALDLLKEHVCRMHPTKPMPYNVLQQSYTVLDLLLLSTYNIRAIQRRMKILADASDSESQETEPIHSGEAVEREQGPEAEFYQRQICIYYKMLREDGALHSDELQGIFHRYAYPSVCRSRANE